MSDEIDVYPVGLLSDLHKLRGVWRHGWTKRRALADLVAHRVVVASGGGCR